MGCMFGRVKLSKFECYAFLGCCSTVPHLWTVTVVGAPIDRVRVRRRLGEYMGGVSEKMRPRRGSARRRRVSRPVWAPEEIHFSCNIIVKVRSDSSKGGLHIESVSGSSEGLGVSRDSVELRTHSANAPWLLHSRSPAATPSTLSTPTD